MLVNMKKLLPKVFFAGATTYGVYSNQETLAQYYQKYSFTINPYFLRLISPVQYQPIYARCDAQDESMNRPYLGCSLRSMIDKEGMVVLLVNTESPGWHAGLKVGDIILEIDGDSVNNINEYYAALAKNSDKKKTFKLLRNGEERLFIVNLI
eukprot:403341310